MKISFEQLPDVVSQLLTKIENIERLLESKNVESLARSDELLTVKGAADLLSLSIPTVYSLISKGQLPVMKRSKRCYFLKDELLKYLKKGRKQTIDEINKQVDNYLNNLK